MTQFYCQIHFNLSTSATHAQHLFGMISVATCPLTSVTFLNFLYPSSPGGTTRKWEIEGMTSLWIFDHI
ncbi:hypothetical protein CMV_025957 [Castanea mollissima]|uniref:Uncharacterized protein n=1 Tax=Castanea mollissima TaxID=60419 RepID=A0A8J4QEL4_9ROSI|nr:hypothetical protein CMV_025957 [Castanea mollissima]